MTTIYLSSTDYKHANAVRAAIAPADYDILPDDHTYVDAGDEIAGAQLFADICAALAEAERRGASRR